MSHQPTKLQQLRPVQHLLVAAPHQLPIHAVEHFQPSEQERARGVRIVGFEDGGLEDLG